MKQLRIFTILWVTAYMHLVFAQGVNADKPTPSTSTEFYKPKVIPQLEEKALKDKTLVEFSGKTLPFSKIGFSKNFIFHSNKKSNVTKVKLFSLKPLDLLSEKKKLTKTFRANHLGFFKFQLLLPVGSVNLPIEIKNKSGPKKYSLNFNVTQKIISTPLELAESPLLHKRFGVWLGFGCNYLQLSQTVDGRYNDFGFSSTKPEAFLINAFWRPHVNWEVQATYNKAPGETTSNSGSSAIDVTTGSYEWLVTAADVLWFPDDWQKKPIKFYGRSYDATYGLVFGYQQHIVPFLVRQFDDVANIQTNNIDMLSVGGIARITTDYKWVYEGFLRYQLPVSSGDLFDVSSSFAFDGSIGVYYQYNKTWRYGLFSYGKYQSLDFSGITDWDSTSITGDQSLLFSNFELRVGIHW